MTLRMDWRAAVLKDKRIGNAPRMLLVVLADHMRDDGYVCYPRAKLAAELNIGQSRVAERMAEAIRVGLLDVVERGKPGRTATYRAVISTAAQVQAKPRRQRPDGLIQHDTIHTHVRTESIPTSGPSESIRTCVPTPSGRPTVSVHPDVRTDPHAQVDTHVQYASSNHKPQLPAQIPSGENQERSEDEDPGSPPDECVTCFVNDELDSTGQCRRCATALAIA